MRNLPLTFDCLYCSQKKVEDFAKFCDLLRIYKLYKSKKPEILGRCGRQKCFSRTNKFGIGIWFLAMQWRRFPHQTLVVRIQSHLETSGSLTIQSKRLVVWVKASLFEEGHTFLMHSNIIFLCLRYALPFEIWLQFWISMLKIV